MAEQEEIDNQVVPLIDHLLRLSFAFIFSLSPIP